MATLITAFILSKVDYCNVALSGLPKRDLDRLLSVINADARLRAGARRYDHVTPLLKELHWLLVYLNVSLVSCVFWCTAVFTVWRRATYKTLFIVSDVTSRRRLRSASLSPLLVPATRRFTPGDQAFAVAGPRA